MWKAHHCLSRALMIGGVDDPGCHADIFPTLSTL